MSITDRMDKLIVNITEAQQKRCDLEAQLHSLDSQCLTLETDITSCQHKNGLLSRQIPDILAELTKQREVNASLSGQLEDQINSRSNMQITLDVMTAKLSLLKGEVAQMQQDSENFVIQVIAAYEENNAACDGVTA